MNFINIIFVFLTISLHTFAQNGMQEKKEQLKKLKNAFLASELGLTTTEAEKFWTLYNVYDDQQFDIRHQKIKSFKNLLKTSFNDSLIR